MFDVGGLKATIELAGEALFTAAVQRAERDLRSLDSAASRSGVSLGRSERALRGAGSAATGNATATRSASTQAAALDRSLDGVSASADAAASSLAAEGEATSGARAHSESLGVTLSSLTDKQKQAMTTVGTSALGMGVAVAAGVGVAVAQYVEFDKAMSTVNASADANAGQMEKLRAKALELGAATSFSATEAAQGETELAKAGVSVASILNGGLQGSLALAAAGQISVADAAETAATALTQFNLKGSDVGHVADLLANGANKAQGGVGDLSQALKQSGLVAAQFGLSVDDTVGTLSAFASAGLIGSDAGTSFKTMLLSLASPSTQAAAAMKQYNIQAYDQQGAFIGTTKLAGVLARAFKGKSQEERNAALSTIFGTDAIRAANVLYTDGEKKIGNWTKAVSVAGGAADTAAKLQDNLAGDLEKLGGSFSTLFISAGSGANGPGRILIQTFTNLLNAVSELPAPVLQTALVLGVATAALLLLGGTALVAIPKVIELNAALVTMATSGLPGVSGAAAFVTRTLTAFGAGMQGAAVRTAGFSRVQLIASSTARGMGSALSSTASLLAGPWGIALAAAGLAVYGLSKYIESLEASTAEYQNTIKTATSAADLFKVADKGTLVSDLDKATDSAKDFQKTLSTLSEGGLKGGFLVGMSLPAQQLRERLKDLGTELGKTATTDLPSAQHAFSLLAAETDGSKEQLGDLLNQMPAYRDALIEQATQQGKSATQGSLLKLAQEQSVPASQAAADAYSQQAQKVEDLSSQMATLIAQINKANGVGQDAVSANVQYQESLATLQADVDAIAKGQDGYAASTDLSTEAGRRNLSALNDMASASQNAAQKTFDQTGSINGFRSSLESGRQKLIAYAEKLGYSADQANHLADQIYKVPSEREFTIIAHTSAAGQAVAALKRQLDAVPRNLSVQLGITKTVQTNTIAPFISQAAKDQASGPKLLKKDGGIVHYYANGGLESHVAEIASAGRMRVWNEPETGGELYAPLAASKRARSREIMKQGAAMFGDHYLSNDDLAALTGGGQQNLVGLGVTGTVDLGGGLIGTIRGVVVQELTKEADVARKGKRN